MKLWFPPLALSVALMVAGCGDDDVAPDLGIPPAAPSAPAVAEAAPPTGSPSAPPVSAPPTGTAPATMEPAAPDLFTTYKVSADGSPNKSDVEAMQAIVDAYAFGPDGLGAPPLNSLDELVTKGYLKRLPPPPQGMKWAYDSPKWKVSLVPQ